MDRCYRTLGLNRGAAEADIKRAYRKKALLLHPDRNPNGAEAFKALQDDYEQALAHVKCRGSRVAGAPSFSSPPPPRQPATHAAGAAFWFARAAGTASSPGSVPRPPTPLFTEQELFGDSIPGGWSGVGARCGAPASRDKKANSMRNSEGPTGEMNGNSSALSEEAAAVDARWRRAHGARVPLSAYEASGPVPHPLTPSEMNPPSTAFSSGTAGAQSRASATATGVPPSTKEEWYAFLSREHQWRSTSAEGSSSHTKGAASSTGKGAPSQGGNGCVDQSDKPASGGGGGETVESRAYREATFLERRMKEFLVKKGERAATHARTHSPFGGASPSDDLDADSAATTASAKQSCCHQQSDLHNDTSSGATGDAPEAEQKGSPHHESRKVEVTQRCQPGDDHAATSTNDGGASTHLDDGNNASGPGARSDLSATAQSSASRGGGPLAGDTPPTKQGFLSGSDFDERLKRNAAHRETILDERRLLQGEYLRHHYTPSPEEVAIMSDMEVYLLASLLKNIHGKVERVMAARLERGPCSCCASAPRAHQHLYFTCTHPSICVGCGASGVLKCPICGAARADRSSSLPQPTAFASSLEESNLSSSAAGTSTATDASATCSSPIVADKTV
ncbi:hypothetical protein JKF63_07524 [Porcisia hertigi]|uniref:J domain-containing protein n=1 Tax=Porcisia hertigi TaxID=2761500 RepID=A0A836ID21_9TRYP|nr:hypothetical protein JKF63_07524 [Porcisia hertigi]